jgi:putative transposase
MPRGRKVSPEQIVVMLRQIEVQLAQGMSLALACKEAGIAEQSYYRWRREYGGLQLEQAKRLKELERENARLRRLVADLSLEKQVLKDVAAGNLCLVAERCWDRVRWAIEAYAWRFERLAKPARPRRS